MRCDGVKGGVEGEGGVWGMGMGMGLMGMGLWEVAPRGQTRIDSPLWVVCALIGSKDQLYDEMMTSKDSKIAHLVEDTFVSYFFLGGGGGGGGVTALVVVFFCRCSCGSPVG